MDDEQRSPLALDEGSPTVEDNGHSAERIAPPPVAPEMSASPQPVPAPPGEPTPSAPPDEAGTPAAPITPGPQVRRIQRRRLNPALLEGPDVIVIRRSTLYGGIFIAVVFFLLGLLVGRYVLPVGGSAGAETGSLMEALGVSADEPAWGPADARIVIIEYSDFQCPYCKMFMENTYARLRQMYSDQVRFIYRDFPLDSIHPRARPAAEAAQCAHEQGKFWEYHDLLFANQQALETDDLKRYAQQLGLDMEQFNTCVDTRKYQASVEADVQAGLRQNVTGTPTFFINGQALVGAQPLEAFQAVIAQLTRAGD